MKTKMAMAIGCMSVLVATQSYAQRYASVEGVGISNITMVAKVNTHVYYDNNSWYCPICNPPKDMVTYSFGHHDMESCPKRINETKETRTKKVLEDTILTFMWQGEEITEIRTRLLKQSIEYFIFIKVTRKWKEVSRAEYEATE